MVNILLLFFCLLAGVALRRSGRMPEGAHLALNGFIIHLSLPALILLQIQHVQLSPALLRPAAMPWIMFVLGVLLFWLLSRLLRLTPSSTGALTLTGGLANTSFIGLPMIETFYGRANLATGIVIDQLGTYLVLSTLGILVACVASGESASAAAILRRVFTFPPLLALALAVLLLPVRYPPVVSSLLGRLGDTLAPLALVSVGLQLRLGQLAGHRGKLALGLGFKLVVAPLLLIALYVGALRSDGETTRVTLFEAAMGPQIGGAIVATQYGLDPVLVSLMVGIGITLSFVTLRYGGGCWTTSRLARNPAPHAEPWLGPGGHARAWRWRVPSFHCATPCWRWR